MCPARSPASTTVCGRHAAHPSPHGGGMSDLIQVRHTPRGAGAVESTARCFRPTEGAGKSARFWSTPADARTLHGFDVFAVVVEGRGQETKLEQTDVRCYNEGSSRREPDHFSRRGRTSSAGEGRSKARASPRSIQSGAPAALHYAAAPPILFAEMGTRHAQLLSSGLVPSISGCAHEAEVLRNHGQSG